MSGLQFHEGCDHTRGVSDWWMDVIKVHSGEDVLYDSFLRGRPHFVGRGSNRYLSISRVRMAHGVLKYRFSNVARSYSRLW